MDYGNNRWYDGCLTAIGRVIFDLVLSLIGVWLWNYAMVSMFSVPEITFWQMFALMVLVRLFIPPTINYNNKKKMSL